MDCINYIAISELPFIIWPTPHNWRGKFSGTLRPDLYFCDGFLHQIYAQITSQLNKNNTQQTKH